MKLETLIREAEESILDEAVEDLQRSHVKH